MRSVFSFLPDIDPLLLTKLLLAGSKEEYFLMLDSNNARDQYSRYEWIAAWGVKEVFAPENGDFFDRLAKFHNDCKDWLFGHLSYSLKDSLEKLESKNEDHLAFAPMTFFIPQTVVYRKSGYIYVESYELHSVRELQLALDAVSDPAKPIQEKIVLQARTSREAYLENVNRLKKELQYGNIYEINYCMEFYSRATIDPVSVFLQLNRSSRAPFSAFYKAGDQYVMCASPERFMYKAGNRLISQPIKGTARRSSLPGEDQQLKDHLYNDPKERSENVMIVDLVRNDLSRTAVKASVKVEELYGIYTYPTVHQMVSTVSSELSPQHHFTEALKYAFPMGSMTGAPKVKAMQLIDQHENFSRSLYSGSLGYIGPDGNFDFNVVIRSLFYNAASRYLSTRVGSAITIHCEAEREYEECLLKAEGLFRVLSYG